MLSLGTVLGVADLGAGRLRDWFWRLHQGVINFEGDPAREEIGAACSREIDEVLAPVFDRLERAGDDSTISHLLHSGMPEGRVRARDFVMPTLKVILLGGMQEPGHGGGSTLAGLLSDPAQRDAVRDDPGLLPAAVEEGLRWVAPIGTQTRQAAVDTELAGVRLPAGAPVGALVSAACRDETKFADPDRFDIFRPRRTNLAFGAGRHFCAGHAFSRAQIRIAIEMRPCSSASGTPPAGPVTGMPPQLLRGLPPRPRVGAAPAPGLPHRPVGARLAPSEPTTPTASQA